MLACAALAVATPAASFDFPEHGYLTDEALALPQARGFVSFAGALSERFPSRICGRKTEAVGAQTCFTVGEIAALAGDHSSSPWNLAKRWFGTGGKDGGTILGAIFDAAGGVGAQAAAPDRVFSQPRIDDFIRAVSAVRLRDQPQDLGYLDKPLFAADADYERLALRNAAHFRIPGIPPPSQTLLSKLPNAVHTFVSYHSSALGIAAIAGDDKSLAATAALLELFALHFLEDCVASGHVVTDRLHVSTTSASLNHDYYNAAGIPITIPEPVCNVLRSADYAYSASRFDRLRHSCASNGQIRTLRGDHSVARRESRKDASDVTEELALLLAAESLRAYSIIQQIAVPQRCRDTVTRCVGIDRTEDCTIDAVGQACGDETARRLGAVQADVLTLLPEQAEPVIPKVGFSGWAIHYSVEGKSYEADGHTAGLNWSVGFGGSLQLPPFRGIATAVGADLIIGFSSLGERIVAYGLDSRARLWAAVAPAYDVPWWIEVGVTGGATFSETNPVQIEPLWSLYFSPLAIDLGRYNISTIRIVPKFNYEKPVAPGGWRVGASVELRYLFNDYWSQ